MAPHASQNAATVSKARIGPEIPVTQESEPPEGKFAMFG
jgi:hypothetical protein